LACLCCGHGRPPIVSHDSGFKGRHVMRGAVNKDVIDAILCLVNHLDEEEEEEEEEEEKMALCVPGLQSASSWTGRRHGR